MGIAREHNISVPLQIFHGSLFQMSILCYTNYTDEITPVNKSKKTVREDVTFWSQLMNCNI